MNSIWQAISYVALGFTLAMTLVMLLTFRQPRPITVLSTVLGIALTVVMLPIYMLLSRIRLNPVLAWPVLGLGLIIGVIWGASTRLYAQGGRVMGRRSLLFLAGWGLSWALSQGLNLLGSALLASAGLLPLFFTTGTHLGSQANLLVRRLYFKAATAVRARA